MDNIVWQNKVNIQICYCQHKFPDMISDLVHPFLGLEDGDIKIKTNDNFKESIQYPQNFLDLLVLLTHCDRIKFRHNAI